MNSGLHSGERQVAPVVSGIRRDHVARYEFAVDRLRQLEIVGIPHSNVIDMGCGIGYGSHLLALSGIGCVAVDHDQESIDYGNEHYAHHRLTRVCCDAQAFSPVVGQEIDAAVCFEALEHFSDPGRVLRALRCAPLLLASVPNEDLFPHRPAYVFHHRHYTKAEFESLLEENGWRVTEWWCQAGPESEVERGTEGRTLIAEAVRVDLPAWPKPKPGERSLAYISGQPANSDTPVRRGPEHVAIIGLGPSCEQYVDLTKRLGGRHKLANEVWAINSLGDVLACDRVFHMDDVRIQEVRAKARPESNIAAMLEWLRTTKTPVMTSRAHPDYPALEEFPLEDVINTLSYAYFNSTAAYAVAYAIYLGVQKISLFGCDYTYPNAHDAEKGRGCVEFWLGIAAARGIGIIIAEKSALMDMVDDAIFKAQEKNADVLNVYGYDCVRVVLKQPAPGAPATLVFENRGALPTADEIEQRYDHTKHPSTLVRG